MSDSTVSNARAVGDRQSIIIIVSSETGVDVGVRQLSSQSLLAEAPRFPAIHSCACFLATLDMDCYFP